MTPPSPFPAGVDLRSYQAKRSSYSCRLKHTLDGGVVSISHRDRDGAMVDEAEAAWLSELARGLDGVRRVWGNEWSLDSRESAILLEGRLAASADLQSRHVTITTPEHGAALIALTRPLGPSGFVSWTFTGLPGDPPSDFGQLNAQAHGARIHLWALRYAERREQDSGWLAPLLGEDVRSRPPKGSARCWSVSEAQWGRVAAAALDIPAASWTGLSAHLNV